MSVFTTMAGCNCTDCKDHRQKRERANGIMPRNEPNTFKWVDVDFGPVEKRVMQQVIMKKLERPGIAYRVEGMTAPVAFFEFPKAEPYPVIKRPAVSQYTIRAFHTDPKEVMGDKIASGFYGAAYEHHIEPLVIKEFDVRDGYPFWAAYAAAAHREGNGNSVLPRIYAITMPEPGTSDKGYLLMERLDKTLNAAIIGGGARSDVVQAYCQGYTSITNAVCSTVSGITNNGVVTPRAVETTLAPVKRAGEHMLKHVSRAVIHAKAAGFELDTDLHNQNAMLRGDDLVLTDPFVLAKRSQYSNEGVLSYIKQVCLRANTYTPGFYSEFRDARREVNHF